jgi:ribonuclease HII
VSPRINPDFTVERSVLEDHHLVGNDMSYVAGMDEVGRGAIAGPVMVGVVVVSAAMITHGDFPLGLADSKLLTQRRREQLVEPVKTWCVSSAVGSAEAQDVDDYGIIAALRLAGERALASLAVSPDVIILDGPHNWLGSGRDDIAPVVTVAKADQRCASVAAASVVAKVERDHVMTNLHEQFPQYGWASNKGYGSAAHRLAIASDGATSLHRRSWNLLGSPVID